MPPGLICSAGWAGTARPRPPTSAPPPWRQPTPSRTSSGAAAERHAKRTGDVEHIAARLSPQVGQRAADAKAAWAAGYPVGPCAIGLVQLLGVAARCRSSASLALESDTPPVPRPSGPVLTSGQSNTGLRSVPEDGRL